MYLTVDRIHGYGHYVCTYLGVHEAEREAHGDGQEPDEYDFEGDSPACLVPAEAHRVA